MLIKWSQENNRVMLTTHKGIYYIAMPKYFNIKEVSPQLKNLAEIVLFGSFEKKTLELSVERKKGKNIGLCYSGGVDSTCALALLPKEKVYLSYLHRTGMRNWLLNQENHLNIMKKLSKNYKVIINSTNTEEIRKRYGKSLGYSSDWHVAVGLILLADYLNLGYISAGTILGSTYLNKGIYYRDFSKSSYWNKWSTLFKKSGLELFLPVAGLTEIMTLQISNKVFGKMAMSCLRGEKGRFCGKCLKCFKRQLMVGKKLRYSKEIKDNLIKKPNIFGYLFVYCCKKFNLIIPEIKGIMKKDVSFCNKYYEKALEIIPVEYKDYIKKEWEKYYSPLKNTNSLESFDLRPKNK